MSFVDYAKGDRGGPWPRTDTELKCPECQRAGLESAIERDYPVGGWGLAFPYEEFLDAKGADHVHDSAPHELRWQCSNGHSFTTDTFNPCPAPDCGWTRLTGKATQGE